MKPAPLAAACPPRRPARRLYAPAATLLDSKRFKVCIASVLEPQLAGRTPFDRRVRPLVQPRPAPARPNGVVRGLPGACGGRHGARRELSTAPWLPPLPAAVLPPAAHPRQHVS